MIEFAVRKSHEAIRKFPDTVIISGTYTIGKERVFLTLAEALGSKIFITKEKERILRCLQWPTLQSLLTTDPCTARVHVLPMKKLNVNVRVFSYIYLLQFHVVVVRFISLQDLSAYLESLQPVFSHLLAFLPTGWSHSSTRASLSTLRPRTTGPVSMYSMLVWFMYLSILLLGIHVLIQAFHTASIAVLLNLSSLCRVCSLKEWSLPSEINQRPREMR